MLRCACMFPLLGLIKAVAHTTQAVFSPNQAAGTLSSCGLDRLQTHVSQRSVGERSVVSCCLSHTLTIVDSISSFVCPAMQTYKIAQTHRAEVARTYVHLFLIIAIGPVRKCVTVECGVTTLTLVKNEWKSIVSKRLRERTHTRNLS